MSVTWENVLIMYFFIHPERLHQFIEKWRILSWQTLMWLLWTTTKE